MSIRWTQAVWGAPNVSHTALPVLLALADHANDDGLCWPAMERLAAMTRKTPRNVRRVIAQAEADGLVRREHRINASTVYHLTLPLAEVRTPASGEDAHVRGGGTQTSGGGGRPRHPREDAHVRLTTREPPDESSSSTTTARAGDPLTSQGLTADDSTAFRAWLKASGARNPNGLIRSLQRDGILTARIAEWRTDLDTHITDKQAVLLRQERVRAQAADAAAAARDGKVIDIRPDQWSAG